MIDSLISDLKEIMSHTKQESFVVKFESKLEQIYSTHNPIIISKLLGVMDDKFEFDELMFSIVHAIESFDDVIYVEEILKSIPDFILKSPRWASIIVMRIINSTETLEIFINQLEDVPYKKKEVLRLLLNSMAKRGSKIEDKVSPLLEVL